MKDQKNGLDYTVMDSSEAHQKQIMPFNTQVSIGISLEEKTRQTKDKINNIF
tara:strand:- start:17280 stop:17435 length:156 start_codon:yes stop_codon:yes gene_type:complete